MYANALPLSVARAGEEVRICAVQGEEFTAHRLRELGVFEGRTLRVVSNNKSLICQVGDCRFGVCRRMARCVLVEPIAMLGLLPT